MEIKYDIEIPISRAEDIDALIKFAEGSKKTMSIEYETEKSAKNRIAVLKRTTKNEKLPVDISRMEKTIYVARLTDEK